MISMHMLAQVMLHVNSTPLSHKNGADMHLQQNLIRASRPYSLNLTLSHRCELNVCQLSLLQYLYELSMQQALLPVAAYC